MTVHFVGAGPGAADLMTLRGLKIVQNCPVCLYAGSLIPQEIVDEAPEGARLVNTAQMTLADIISEMAAAHQAGLDVARLHSGDLSIYSAMAEQMRRLDGLRIPYEVIPGVPAFAAAAAVLKQELTLPQVNQSLVITRISQNSTPMPDGEKLAQFAASGATLALHLSAGHVDSLVGELIPFYGDDCPVVVAARVSRPDELILRSSLGKLVNDMAQADITRTAIIFVGPAMAPSGFADSYLYS